MVSIASNATGLFQDTSHSDDVVAGDDFDYIFNSGNDPLFP